MQTQLEIVTWRGMLRLRKLRGEESLSFCVPNTWSFDENPVKDGLINCAELS